MTESQCSMSRDAVIFGYRFLLGREPESEQMIEYQLATHPDFASFRSALLSCDEFRAQMPSSYLETVADGYWSATTHVDYRVPVDVEARLIERTRNQWTKLGEEEPYWSVLTNSDFRTDRITDAALSAFRDSGRQSADLIDLTLSRAQLPSVRGVCVELGCGVGRITRHLADRFDKVIAVDISPGNLALCRRYMDDECISNVQTILITDADDLSRLPEYDFLYSVIVLQHNAPPVQFRMLDLLFSRISIGGLCLIQTVVDMPGYEFSTETYLNTVEPVMEVHSLPMVGVLSLMHEHDLAVKSVRMDPWVDVYGSYTFLGHKPDRLLSDARD